MSKKLRALYLMDHDVLPLVYGPAERQELGEHATFDAPPFSAQSLLSYQGDLTSVEAIFSSWGMPPLDETLLARLPACAVIFHAAGTVRTFATPAAWQRGVRITTAAEANAIPVAEYTLATIILSLKHGWQRILELRERRVSERHDPLMPGAFDRTVGLLSLSRIGRKVAERLRLLDVRVIAYDPVVDPRKAAALGVELCPLEEVFARADVVSCHMPLLPQTTGQLQGRHFSAMKPGATFINTARGALVRESELLAVLRQRPDLCAVLDVVADEPIAPGSPLLGLPNLIVTPHIAGSLGPECRRLGRFMLGEVARYLRGEPLIGEVSPAHLSYVA